MCICTYSYEENKLSKYEYFFPVIYPVLDNVLKVKPRENIFKTQTWKIAYGTT